MRILSAVLTILIALLGITFAYLNANPVTVNYYLATKTIPLSLLLVITLALGVSLGLMITLATYIRLKGENISLQRKLKLSEKELVQLRSLPIKDLS